MININELRRLAQAATPGGWYVKRGNYIYGCKEVTDGEEKWRPVIACTDDDEVNVNFEANAAFIAAANPAAISELLDRLEAAEKERDKLRAELNALQAQRPVGTVQWIQGWPVVNAYDGVLLEPNKQLYALPGAKGE